jgi:hypothetical protein
MDTLDLSEGCFDAANFVIAGAAKQSVGADRLVDR